MQGHMDKNPRAVGNLLVMAMFACLGLTGIISRDYVGASLWLSLAAAFASLGPESTPWPEIPQWRRLVGLILLGASVILFGLQIGRDFAS